MSGLWVRVMGVVDPVKRKKWLLDYGEEVFRVCGTSVDHLRIRVRISMGFGLGLGSG